MIPQQNFQVNLQADPQMMMQAGQQMMHHQQMMQQPQYMGQGGGGIPPGPPEGGPGGKMPIRIHFDTSYLKTPPGMLKIAEIINNVVGMICIMMSDCSWCSNSNWYNFVASTGLTVTLILLLLYLAHVVERLKFIPWLGIELLYCAVWTLFYMIAALVVSVKGARDDAWAAAGFFGFAGAILYASDCHSKYKSWRDGIPAQGEKPMTPNYDAY